MKINFKLGLYLPVILLAFSQLLNAQGNNGPDTIPFELTSHNNLSIKAVLNEKDTVDLMFHTAAGSVTLTSEAINTITSINWDSEEEVSSWGGDATARYSASNALAITSLKWDSIAIWETKESGPGTGGKFGPNLFDGSVIEIDFEQRVIILHDTLPEKTVAFNKVPVFYEDGFMFIQGTSAIGGTDYPNRFLIHSGYGGAILYDDKFTAESHIGAHIEILEEKELKDSYGNVLKIKKGKLPKFTIGEVTFEDIPVGFFEGTIGRQQMSVMGGDLLKRFNLIIDIKREYIYIQPNSLMKLDYSKR
ncbi:MAG: hypothetical protein ACRBG0_15025 [Lewinella sp.]|uniref:hypothetical protein n=1 Tax=Lewinella sp. TaxID=2004506 RepID=UPI003D6B8063